MGWQIEKLPELKGFTIEVAEQENFILSKANSLYNTKDLRKPFEKIAEIKAPLWKKFSSNFRPAQRLLRFMVTNVIPLENNDLFVTFDKSVGLIKNGNYKSLEGLERPCRVLRSACAIDNKGDIYFGEYLANPEREEMFVYRFIKESGFLEKIFTFKKNEIRHIHGLYFDKFTNAIYCLTGDEKRECKILKTTDGFKKTEIIGEGDESWRAVSLLFSEDNFFYGTDAEFRENEIFRVDRQSLDRKAICKVSGTVFYSKKIGEDLFFTTTAENAPSQKENVAALWHIDEIDNCTEIIKFKKDWFNKTLFMLGTIHFPTINNFKDRLYFHLVGVDDDNQTFCLKRAN